VATGVSMPNAKSVPELLQERQERIRRSAAVETNDRAPVVLQMSGFCARHVGVPMKDFCSSLARSSEIILESAKALGNFDAVESAYSSAPLFPLSVFCKIKMPGRELPDDALWQIDERELLSIGDYDRILAEGWPGFYTDFIKNRLGIDLDAIRAEAAAAPQMIANFETAGYPVYAKISFTLVNELLSGGRSMPKFMRDIYKTPDKVEAVLDVIQEGEIKRARDMIRARKADIVFVSPSRGASAFFAPKLWERFIWKYLYSIGTAIIEEGAVMNVHADGDWIRDIDCFKAFPRGKVIFEGDSGTDLRKIKAKLGDWMCLKGDVPPAMLSHGTPDQVYEYSRKLIEDLGDGFILSSGCAVPDIAPVANVKAMISAATGE
jgi:hypothetical protein